MPRRDASVPTAPPAKKPWETPPPGFSASLAHWAIYWAAQRRFGANSEGANWYFQSPYVGGIPYPGGVTTDFWFLEYQIAVQIASFRGPAATDLMQRIALESVKVQLVDIDSGDALRAPIAMLDDALHGISHAQVGASGATAVRQ